MYWLNWHIAVPNIFALIILPMTTFSFFCKYCGISVRWPYKVLYIFLSAALYILEQWTGIHGSPGLLAEILLLTAFGIFLMHIRWSKSFSVSVLILSVLSISSGILCWFGYQVILPAAIVHEVLIAPSDTVRECLKVLLVFGFFRFILQHFQRSIAAANSRTLLQLSIPVLFISLVERILQTSFYGDEITFNSQTGEIVPTVKIDHMELLFLQLFAGICLLAILFAYRKIVDILSTEQKLLLLEQQCMEQKSYVRDALARYEQTRSFRHDMKNHLTVLSGLLKEGQTDQAHAYLASLDQTVTAMSYPIQTGNVVADALVGSKLFVARQKKIRLQCEMKLPEGGQIPDMDWCIILSNALDNALNACDALPEEERYICIFSRKKKNFFLMEIENSCDPSLTEVPADGTGLSNIRTVVKKYHGAVENSVSRGCYKLKVLVNSSQQNSLQ